MAADTLIFSCYSNGKLLLTGEYLILFGARALATPVKFGQYMEVYETKSEGMLSWEAFMEDDLWFKTDLIIPSLEIVNSTDSYKAIYLQKALSFAQKLNPEFLSDNKGLMIKTTLNYPQCWGLGSSATFITNLATWANLNPMELHAALFSGSGYDVSCALSDSAIIFERNELEYIIHPIQYQPAFKDHIYFLYQGKKQDTETSIRTFYNEYSRQEKDIEFINFITNHFVNAQTKEEASHYIDLHEGFVGNLLQIPPIKQRLFPDFSGSVKSLGAWGGDFALILSNLSLIETKDYFHTKGFDSLFKFDELILNKNTD
jgi:mevalonate kinase